jgi:hypothetical protein
MVGHPIEDHGHAASMRLGDQRAQIVETAEVGVHFFVVAHAVGRVGGFDDADRRDGHQVDDVDAQGADLVEAIGNALKAPVAEGAQVHLVDDRIARIGHAREGRCRVARARVARDVDNNVTRGAIGHDAAAVLNRHAGAGA